MNSVYPICLEEFANNSKSEKAPKILSCGHTFCCKCIKLKMKKDNNQIICLFDMLKDKRLYEELPFNRIIFDLIKVKQLKKIEIENRKIDFSLNIGILGDNSVGKKSLSINYEKNEP